MTAALFYVRRAESMGTLNGLQHTSVVVYTRPEAIEPPSATQESQAHEAVTHGVADKQIPTTGRSAIGSVGTASRRPSADDPIPNQNKSNAIPPSLVPIIAHRGGNRKVSIRYNSRAATELDHQHPGLTFAVASYMNPLVRTASTKSVYGDAPSIRPGSYFTRHLRSDVRPPVSATPDPSGIQEKAAATRRSRAASNGRITSIWARIRPVDSHEPNTGAAAERECANARALSGATNHPALAA